MILCAFSALPAFAELTAEQKAHDFQSMAALYSKRYGPYEWKKWAYGFDALDIAVWVDRARKSTTDIEFFEICAEYVARLKDTHSSFSAPINFVANLGIVVDIYDGKLLIESINRQLLPSTAYPFQIGDELVTLDGKDMEQWITELGKYRQWGSPRHDTPVCRGRHHLPAGQFVSDGGQSRR